MRILSVRRRQPRSSPGIVHHMTRRLPECDVVVVDGIPTTSVARTVCDLGVVLTKHQIACMLDEATFKRCLDVDQLSTVVDQRSGAPGIGEVREAIRLFGQGCRGTRSRTEDHFLNRAIARGIEEPVVNTRGATGLLGVEVDFVWPRHGVLLEIDGSGHDRPGAREEDDRRDGEHRANGWLVLRASAGRVWHDIDGLCDEVVHALRCRGMRRTAVDSFRGREPSGSSWWNAHGSLLLRSDEGNRGPAIR